MSATEVLRRLLDERGMEWGNIRNDGSESDYLTEWQFENNQGKAIAIEWAVGSGLSVEIHRYHLTPEQVIAATLGSCNCSNNCTNSERTGTCQADETDTWECVRDDLGGYGKTMTVHVMECTECGHTYEHVNGDYEYCPRCGRKREDVSE